MKTQLFSFAAFLLVAACGPGPVVTPDIEPTADAAPEAAPIRFVDASSDAPLLEKEAASCDPPDMLVILDRSDSMSSMVGTQGTRIDLAISAIKTITQAPTDTSVRFGLQVLPQVGGVECSTQLVVPMSLGTGAAIQNALVQMSPQLDYGTPIGGALVSAQQTLAKSKVSGRDQYVVLITDGAECCSCNTDDYDIGVAQQLYAAGIKLFAVGFGGDDDPVLLNNLACAGHTAANFATDCDCVGDACKLSAKVDSTKTQDYYKATDGTALKKAVASITNQVCCDCNVNPN